MAPFLKFGFKKPLFYGGLILLILSALSPFILTWFINTAYVKERISSYVLKETGAQLTPESFSFILFPQAGLTIEDLSLHPSEKIDLFIDALKFDLDLKPLLHGSLNIRQIKIDHPVVKFKPAEKKALTPSADGFISDAVAGLKNIFDILPEYQKSVKLSINKGSYPNIKQIDGSIILSKEKKQLHLNTTLKGIGFSPSDLVNDSDSFNSMLDLKFVKLDQIDLFAMFDSNGDIHGNCSFISPELTSTDQTVLFDVPLIKSVFSLTDDGFKIDIAPFKLNYPKGSLGVHFSNDPIQKKTSVQFTGSNIQIDQARKMSFTLFKDNHVTNSIFDIVRNGTVPNIDVTFNGKTLNDLFNPHHFTLKGNVKNGLIHIPETHLTASKVVGHAYIHDGILDVTAQNGTVQNSKIEQGKLSIDLMNHKNFPFQGEFLLDLDLSLVPETLISLLPGTLTAQELSLVHDVTGRANAKLNLSMGINAPNLDVTVKANNFSINGRYDRIPGDINLENLNFTYEPDDTIHLDQVKGTINDSTIYDLDAEFEFKNEAWMDIKSGSGLIVLDAMIPWLMAHSRSQKFISPVQKAGGELHFKTIHLSGPMFSPEQWTFNTAGKAIGVDATTDSDQPQIKDLSCQYLASNDRLSLTDIQMKIIRLSWLSPLIEQKHTDSIIVPLKMANGNFHTSAKQSFLNGDLKFISGPELSIDLTGENLSSLVFESIKMMDQGLSDAIITFNSNGDKPLFDFSGILDTRTLKKLVIPDSYWDGRIESFTEGHPILIHTDKDDSLHIRTKHLNLDSMFTQSKSFSVDKHLIPDTPIYLKADEIKIKTLKLTDIDTKISLEKDASHITLNKALLCDLDTKGSIKFNTNNLYADIVFKADNKPNIQDLLTCLLQTNEFMDGSYSLSGRITSDAPNPDALKAINGSVILTARDGRIYKWTLLSRILSVLNVSKVFKGKIPNVLQKGFAYRTISIEADIKESKIHLTKAIIDGNDMTLIFNGWIDPVTDSLDLVCLVAPFKTVDLIVKNIPLINTLLEGRLVSVPLKATGKISDPTVIPMHPSAVGSGLVNMMSGILNTPVKLWDKLSGE